MIAAILAATYSITMSGLNAKVVEAQAVAERWVADPVCQVLFPKGTDALATLRGQSYRDPQSLGWDLICLFRNATALVDVGSNEVMICLTFANESLNYRAAILIHEALHTAGVEERTLLQPSTKLPTSEMLQNSVLLLCNPGNRETLIRLLEERRVKNGR